MADLVLKKGRERPVLHRHPWIFSGSISEVIGNPLPGETVRILDSGGTPLAWAGYSPHSQIRGRIWSWDPGERIGPEYFKSLVTRAIEYRQSLDLPETNACRWIHAESDRLPGLIVDKYDTTLVVQFLCAGIETWREPIIETLESFPGIDRVYERSDSDVRMLEGLAPRHGLLAGSMPDREIPILENGLRFDVDIRSGQKTGYYLDQRRTRLQVSALSEERSVLDCYSYTGSCSIHAARGGAERVTAIESSEAAIRLARQNASLNGLNDDRIEWLHGDVPSVLRTFRDRSLKFDLIILDPPNFAPTAAHAPRASRAYKDINLLAFKLLNPGGYLVTCSCSGGVSPDLFTKIVTGAAMDAGVEAQVFDWIHQGEDHPVRLYFPEGAYLKGLVCRVS